jgi:PAS domain S-box-containing protein
LKLLRSEHCLILKVEGSPGNEDVTLASGELRAEYSRTMARRALAVGRAVAFVQGAPDNSSESVLLDRVRSALCAPIFVRGRAVSCFYVSHRQVAGLFGEAEECLADFVATLAGAALENAEGFTELRRLNETLEHQIGESQKAERRIQEQAALLDKARDAISVLDLEDRILFWNQSSERLYGWSAQDALGEKAQDLSCQAIVSQLAQVHATALERGEWAGELPQVTKTGQNIVVESRWTLVRDDAGQPKSMLVVNTDITEKKKLEAQFLRAQRMESLGTLAGGIAHDINNVLTPIMMALDLLKMDLPHQQRNHFVNELQICAQRGADMVKQILSFARGVEGQRVPLQLKYVLNDLTKMLQRTLPKSIEIRTDFSGRLWLVSGDTTQLYQMVMNLCVNARDAMPRGGTLTLLAANMVLDETAALIHPEAKPGAYLRLTVQDTGCGIPGDILDKVFDPFFTTKEFGKGTGLGLSTVLGIVKGHGGFLNVSTELNKGTQFQIFLPAVPTDSDVTAHETAPILPRGHGELILLVDDEAAIRQITQKNLEAHGYKVVTASNGLEAGALYLQHQQEIQLVLTDMAMPGMDGSATIQILKKLNPRLPVIAASGLSTSLEAAQKAGADFQATLVKPFTVDNLLKTVNAVLHDGVYGTSM